MNIRRLSLYLLTISALAACGGGGGGNPADRHLSGSTLSHANLCSPANPLARDGSGAFLPGYHAGSIENERAFVRQYMQDQYLWHHEMSLVAPSLDAFNTSDHAGNMNRWFRSHLTTAKTAAGTFKDRFSFAMSTAEWKASSQAGVVLGYGAQFAVLKNEVPRRVVVAYVLEGTPAARLGLQRGDEVVGVVGSQGRMIDVRNTRDQAELAEVNQRLLNPVNGQELGLSVQRAGAVQPAVQLQAGEYRANPVQISTVLDTADGGKIGYLMFNRFILPLESAMIEAVERLKAAQVTDAVIDLRYNGGGYLYQSSQLAWMLADPALTQGKIYERLRYNDRRQAENQSPDSVLEFRTTSSGTDGTGTGAGRALPNLGLRRVYVLTGPDTCSASESLINGLRGVDVEIVQIGNATCGKPYGFTARDNCGMSYFPIEFVGVNAKGANDFENGFVPTCRVDDDFSHALGDTREGLLAAALHHRRTGQCPTPVAAKSLGDDDASFAKPLLRLGPQFTNKFLMP
ncbi:MAG: S41 family peptidase [Lautropia sp.]|nr:S41 family peptidase [Lautropia sp.]